MNKKSNKGCFIAVEGLEGAGKTTSIDYICQLIKNECNVNIVKTREPGGTPIAEKLRSILKQVTTKEDITVQAEVLMMYASRVQLVESEIKPALSRGDWVVGDRHNLSSYAYQGAGRGVSHKVLDCLSEFCLESFKPDLTFYLDIPAELGMSRVQLRGEKDRIEQEPMHFFEKIRQSYLEAANNDPTIITIDSSGSIESMQQAIFEQWTEFLTLRKTG